MTSNKFLQEKYQNLSQNQLKKLFYLVTKVDPKTKLNFRFKEDTLEIFEDLDGQTVTYQLSFLRQVEKISEILAGK